MQPHHVSISLTIIFYSTDKFLPSCRCKHQFCYICGAKWKTCTCQQWQDAHLQERLRQEEQAAMFGRPEHAEHLHRLEMRARYLAFRVELQRVMREAYYNFFQL